MSPLKLSFVLILSVVLALIVQRPSAQEIQKQEQKQNGHRSDQPTSGAKEQKLEQEQPKAGNQSAASIQRRPVGIINAPETDLAADQNKTQANLEAPFDGWFWWRPTWRAEVWAAGFAGLAALIAAWQLRMFRHQLGIMRATLENSTTPVLDVANVRAT
jgi:hypothetical protein